jgi:hypothetical protein
MTDAQTKAIKEGRDRSNGVTAWQLLRQQLALALRTLRLRLRRTVPHCDTPGRTAHCALRQRQRQLAADQLGRGVATPRCGSPQRPDCGSRRKIALT